MKVNRGIGNQLRKIEICFGIKEMEIKNTEENRDWRIF